MVLRDKCVHLLRPVQNRRPLFTNRPFGDSSFLSILLYVGALPYRVYAQVLTLQFPPSFCQVGGSQINKWPRVPEDHQQEDPQFDFV